MGDRDRDRHKEAERDRERQLVRDWQKLNTDYGARLGRSTSTPSHQKPPLFRITSRNNPPKQPAAPPPRPVIRHPEPATEQSVQRLPSRDEVARYQEERRKHGYGPLPNPNDFDGVPAGPNAKTRLHRSSSMSQLPSYVPFLARKPRMLADEDLARARAEVEERSQRIQKELDAKTSWRPGGRPPEWGDPDLYPEPTADDIEAMARLTPPEEKGVVRTKGGATISPPLPQGPLQPDLLEDSYTKPRAVPPTPTKHPFRDPRSPPKTAKSGSRGLRRSSSEVHLQDLLREQQRLARENKDAQRLAGRRNHSRHPSHDVTKPTVPLKLHKKSSSSDMYMSSSPAILSSIQSAAPQSDRRDDVRKRDPSAQSANRRRGPPMSQSAKYSEPYFTPPMSGRGAKAAPVKKSSKHVPSASADDVNTRMRAQPATGTPGPLQAPPQPGPMSLSPPRMQRHLSDESSGSSRSRSRSHHHGPPAAAATSSPVLVPGASSRAPSRQNTAPQPATQGLASSAPTSTFFSAFKPLHKTSSVAQRREKSVDRVVIFPTDQYGMPLDNNKDLPDTPSVYTPTNFGPPSPTTKPHFIPSLPANTRVGTNAMLDAPLSTLQLSPGTQIKELGGQHKVEVSMPRKSVVAVSGFVAEIVSGSHIPQVSSPLYSPKRYHHHEKSEKERSRHREERSHRGRPEREQSRHREEKSHRHERREEKSVDGRRHVRQIYAPPAPVPEQVKRIYIPPTLASPPPKRQIYAPATAIDRTRAEPSTAHGGGSPPAAAGASRRADHGNIYSGYPHRY